MKIGLVDIDLLIQPNSKILNVELMKLGAYYEELGHQVEVLHPKSYIYDYDKLCIFCNSHLPIESFLKHPDIDFYGTYYNNRKFVPFGNQIDEQETNYRIYDNLLKYYLYSNIYTEKDIEKIKRAKWLRLYPNEKPIDIYKVLIPDRKVIVDNDFFDKEGWREYFKKVSIYERSICFARPIIIRNQQNLEDFNYLLQFNFVNLYGVILTSTYEEFEQLITNNTEILKKMEKRLYFSIAYNKDNLYTEDFYLKELIPTVQKALLLSKINITFTGADILLYSKKPLTKAVYYSFERWFRDGKYNDFTYEGIFLVDNKYHPEVIKYYRNFLEKKPEYKKWFRRIINKED